MMGIFLLPACSAATRLAGLRNSQCFVPAARGPASRRHTHLLRFLCPLSPQPAIRPLRGRVPVFVRNRNELKKASQAQREFSGSKPKQHITYVSEIK